MSTATAAAAASAGGSTGGSAGGSAAGSAPRAAPPKNAVIKKHNEAYQITRHVKSNIVANPMAWALWGVDFGVWLTSLVGPYRWYRTVQARSEETSREVSRADRVSIFAVGDQPPHLIPGEESVRTAHDLMQRNFARFEHYRAFGIRKYLGEHKPEGQRFPLKLFGETQWLTYGEVGRRAKAFGSGLIALGLAPQPVGIPFDDLTGPHSLLLWEDTSAEFCTALVAAGGHSIAVVTSYATLGVSAVAEAIQQGNVRVILANYRQVASMAALKAQCPTLETIIVSYLNVADEERAPLPPVEGVRLIPFDEVLAIGERTPVEFTPPRPETISVVMYTSGSTGAPKGVVIRHESFVASTAALYMWMRKNADLVEGGEAYCAYLPAAHILELVAEHAMMTIGAEIGFADPRTITSRGACRRRPDGTISTTPGWPYPPGALQEFRPTLLAGVPKIWDVMKKAVEAQVGAAPAKRWVLDVAFPARASAVAAGRETPLFKLLFKKIAGIVGGRLKLGLTGGGPCSSDVQTFVRTAFAMPFIQGYALTETCCAGCIQFLSDTRDGVVGPPFASVRIRLNDTTDVMDKHARPYLSTDSSHLGEPCSGRGEVWISGVSVAQGYYKMPEKTAEAFVMHEGVRWFRTGDIGVWTPDGCLRIVDRLKNLVKLKGGEYIAIENMESVYGASPLVDALNGGIMCYGDGELDKPVAFVQIQGRPLEEWARAKGVAYTTVMDLCETPEAEEYVTSQLNAIGKRGGLSALELLGGVKLFAGTGEKAATPMGRHDPWTPENGGLTATSKLNRKTIQGSFEAEMADAATRYGIRPG